jgi:hypothetical protein
MKTLSLNTISQGNYKKSHSAIDDLPNGFFAGSRIETLYKEFPS